MPPGPLPKPADQRRRRNQPTIPTTSLPASGRQAPAPVCPYELGELGELWWAWAWALPQACGWSDGDLWMVARRAQLEDDVKALDAVDGLLDFEELLASAEVEQALRTVERVVGRLKSLVGGKKSLLAEMRELDDRLGLTPKGLAALRWTIVKDAEPEAPPAPSSKPGRRLRAVDPAAS